MLAYTTGTRGREPTDNDELEQVTLAGNIILQGAHGNIVPSPSSFLLYSTVDQAEEMGEAVRVEVVFLAIIGYLSDATW